MRQKGLGGTVDRRQSIAKSAGYVKSKAVDPVGPSLVGSGFIAAETAAGNDLSAQTSRQAASTNIDDILNGK